MTQRKEFSPKGKNIVVSDPDGYDRAILKDAVNNHHHRLHYDERSMAGIIRLLIRNVDVCLEAIRPDHGNPVLRREILAAKRRAQGPDAEKHRPVKFRDDE